MRTNELNQYEFLHEFTLLIFTHPFQKVFESDFLFIESLFQESSNITSCLYTTEIIQYLLRSFIFGVNDSLEIVVIIRIINYLCHF